IRPTRNGGPDIDWDRLNADYYKSFRNYGIDLEALEPAQAGELIRAQAIHQELLAALDHWARLLTEPTTEKETWKRLLQIARQADTDSWRNQVRRAVEQGDVEALKALTRSDQVKDLPPPTLGLFAWTLRQLRATHEARELLREAQRHHPGDYWINYDLGRLCD